MTGLEFKAQLQARATGLGLPIAEPVLDALETYFQLLARWNRTINLTAVPLDPPTNATFDRMFIEPLAASYSLPELPAADWLDLGSGGGSPAIPLLLVRSDLRLTMVEARERKASFLREVVRTLGVNARVEVRRFEDLLTAGSQAAGLVTARGLRMDRPFFEAAAEFLRDGGVLLLFGRGSPSKAGVKAQQSWFTPIARSESPFADSLDPGRELLISLELFRRVPRETIQLGQGPGSKSSR